MMTSRYSYLAGLAVLLYALATGCAVGRTGPDLTVARQPWAFLGAEGLSTRSRGRVYTIHAEGRSRGGAVFARQAVVRLGGGARGFRIEAWKQGRRILFAEADADAGPDD